MKGGKGIGQWEGPEQRQVLKVATMSRHSAPVIMGFVFPSVAIAMLVLLLSFQPSFAHRKLSARQDASDLGACGYFDYNDPTDAGLAHQPCYGPDNTIQFCW